MTAESSDLMAALQAGIESAKEWQEAEQQIHLVIGNKAASTRNDPERRAQAAVQEAYTQLIALFDHLYCDHNDADLEPLRDILHHIRISRYRLHLFLDRPRVEQT